MIFIKNLLTRYRFENIFFIRLKIILLKNNCVGYSKLIVRMSKLLVILLILCFLT